MRTKPNSSSISELLLHSSHPRQNVLTQDAPQMVCKLTHLRNQVTRLPPAILHTFLLQQAATLLPDLHLVKIRLHLALSSSILHEAATSDCLALCASTLQNGSILSVNAETECTISLWTKTHHCLSKHCP